MTGTFNAQENRDYALFLSHQEFEELKDGKVLAGPLTHYWNNEKTDRVLTISLTSENYFKRMFGHIKKTKDFRSHSFAKKVLLGIRNEKEHMFYLNCDLRTTETIGGLVFEQRYCDLFFNKIFLYIADPLES